MMEDGTRLTAQRLCEITGKRRPSAQLRWFKALYGVTLPCDVAGPVISGKAFEGMIARKCGLTTTTEPPPPRPKIQPKK